MNILVTGSSGRIGHYAVEDLQNAGHQVLGIDIVSGPKTGLVVDLAKSGELFQALARAKAEAVVHMGAWANPGVVPDTRTYGENVQGSFNLFQACAELGIKRIVSASSAQVYGFAGAPPEFVRVDESHPTRPMNCYALSKVAGEQAADYFVRNFGLEILSFRFMGIRSPDELNQEVDRLVAQPETGGGLLWTRTDVRDAARACRLAVEASSPASGPYNITGARVLLDVDAGELVHKYCDGVEDRGNLVGCESPMSCERAKQAFGYEAEYAWSVSERHYR
ncbi:MAG: NAD(P)-dependent oxidoreductase [Candidatus Latescibacteria bacterium]|jgi:nucleoside-diphosphate-sugar epimerase|nr:NAD(P)-dependent oxidoreductase [Candidatus Latescibacterota bacterium]MBT5832049.1 NAD(P)-dependent oxidoreductase [Candidatus Latescibacterota bacterium]